MKKLLAIALSAIAILSFAACSSGKTEIGIKDNKSLQDVLDAVDVKFAEKYGSEYTAVPMKENINETFLADMMGLEKSAYDEFAGGMSMSMTNSDALIAIKAKSDKKEEVKAALEKRLADLVGQYEFYPVNGSLERAQGGEVYEKGDYYFLIVVGVLTNENMDAPDFSADVKMVKDTIDSMFTA